MPEPSIDWPALLQDYRTSRGLKQSAAAADFGVSQGTISRWESGACRPGVAMQTRIARIALRDRSPLHADTWMETFARMLAPGLAVAPDRRVAAVTPALCEQIGVEDDAIVGVPFDEAMTGLVLDLAHEITRAGLLEGRVTRVEACHRVDISPRLRRTHYHAHYILWPHVDVNGRISVVSSGAIVTAEQASEIQARLGGALAPTLVERAMTRIGRTSAGGAPGSAPPPTAPSSR